MTPRERVLKAVRHEEPDRVPRFYRDVPEVEVRLRRDLGCDTRDALLERVEAVARELGVDGVTARAVALEELFIELLGGRL